ncbi:unannotated protein [freshwater metagenome]|uniref:Unannotated protein n=1 Tax=freshwater metagenome TaxID=449393 RepID=A0A6J7DVN3_9ZZZZ|nr:hypothetical protein [Actinomycetota bacterium]
MTRVQRRRVVNASQAQVWETAGDLRRLSRWWPRVVRVESIDASGFTEVLRTDRGRNLRADHVLEEVDPGRLWRARQTLDDGPFASIFALSVKWVALEPAADGSTAVTVGIERRLRGRARLGGLLLRRAVRRQVSEALDALVASLATDR